MNVVYYIYYISSLLVKVMYKRIIIFLLIRCQKWITLYVAQLFN